MPNGRVRSKSWLKPLLINLITYLFFLALATVVIWPQIHGRAFISGTDSLFHMNRFYETVMQIKTGHFSYFQSIFGFDRIGRIVNAFYGPVFAYLAGAVLKLAGSWYRFQIVTSLLVLSLSGYFMDLLCVKNRVKRFYALIMGGIYMTSFPISLWVTSQEFTGWGATFMPLVLLCGTDMLRHHRVRVIPLAISMTILLQTHILSSLIGALALIPLFWFGYRHTANRSQMLLDGFRAFGLTILLTANVWGGLVDLFSTNHIMPVWPQKYFNWSSFNGPFIKSKFGLILLVFLLLVIANLILNWRSEGRFQRVIDLTSLVFMWIGSSWFPWQLLHRYVTSVTNLVQFPFRFLVIPMALLPLSLGMTFSRQPFLISLGPDNHLNRIFRAIKDFAVLVALVMAVGNFNEIVQDRTRIFASKQVVSQPHGLLHRQTRSSSAIRQHFYVRDLDLSLQDFDKSTPDYLPMLHPLKSNQDYYRMHPYHLVRAQLDGNPGSFSKRIVNGSRIRVRWDNRATRSKLVTVPLVAYHQSVICFNHSRVHPKLSSVGAIRIKGRPGTNVLTVGYRPDVSMQLANLIAVLAGLGLVIYLLVNVYRLPRSRR